jgi:hypothetical protein
MKNQIGHILINAGHTKDAMNFRSCNRNDCNSDHFLVRIKLKPKILVRGIRSGKMTKRYDTTKLKAQIGDNLLEEKLVLSCTVQEKWQNFKQSIQTTEKETTGYKNKEKQK